MYVIVDWYAQDAAVRDCYIYTVMMFWIEWDAVSVCHISEI